MKPAIPSLTVGTVDRHAACVVKMRRVKGCSQRVKVLRGKGVNVEMHMWSVG